jgi:serine/threonine protein kinase
VGLQHAHERGLVHRDIKPSNLLVTTHGEVVKILDLGLARSEAADLGATAGSHLTQIGTLVGTPDYIAPEQILNPRRADIRADIYSLGGTFYFLLTARPPFVGGSLAEKLCWHQGAEPTPIEQLCPEVPTAVGAVLRKMLAKRPEDRYQTPGEVAIALAPFANRQGRRAGEQGPLANGPALFPTELSYGGNELTPPQIPTWVLVVIGGGCLLLLVLLVLVWSMS